MGPRFGPIYTPDQEIPPSTNRKVRYPVQQSGARRAFKARAPRSARSVAAGGRIFRLRCWRFANFEQATNVFGPFLLEVCSFLAGHQHFCPETASGLSKISRPAAAGAEGVAEIQKILYFCTGREWLTEMYLPRIPLGLYSSKKKENNYEDSISGCIYDGQCEP